MNKKKTGLPLLNQVTRNRANMIKDETQYSRGSSLILLQSKQLYARRSFHSSSPEKRHQRLVPAGLQWMGHFFSENHSGSTFILHIYLKQLCRLQELYEARESTFLVLEQLEF